MRIYDFNRAKSIIESRKDEIVKASLGLYQDWFWTAQTIYEDGAYTGDVEVSFTGINGSTWATPTLRILLKDGNEECIACYVGVGSRDQPPLPIPFGVLSEPVQDNMPQLQFSKEELH